MKIYLFGLGAIGSNLLVQLAKKYPDFEYHGIDFDKVEERNIKTQAYFINHIQVPKTSAIQAVVGRYITNFKYNQHNVKIDTIDDVKKIIKADSTDSRLILDCFDNSKSRKIIHDFGDKEILHIGFSPQYTAEIIWHDHYTVPNDVDPARNDICALNDAVPFIGFVVNFAAMIISDYIESSIQKNFIITHKYKIISI